MTSFVISVREEGGAENLSGKPDILGAQSHIVGQLRHSPTQGRESRGFIDGGRAGRWQVR